MSDEKDRIILAFHPSETDHARNGHRWTIYNPALDNPYAVENASEKLNQAIDAIDPHDYERRGNEFWIRLDWETAVDDDKELKRLEADT